MDADEFRKAGHDVADMPADYLDTVDRREFVIGSPHLVAVSVLQSGLPNRAVYTGTIAARTRRRTSAGRPTAGIALSRSGS